MKVDDTDIHTAASQGNLALVRQLLTDQGCDVNKVDETSLCTPIHCAMDAGHEDLAIELLSHPKCDVHVKRHYANIHMKENRSTYLHLACGKKKGFPKVAKFLLERPDCDVHARDAFKRAPLNLATAFGHIDIVRMLLARDDCDVNVGDRDKRPPLYYSCEEGHVEIVRMLLNHKDCNVNLLDHVGSTSFHRCFRKENSTKTIREFMTMFLARDDISPSLTQVNMKRQSVMVRLLEYKGEMNNYFFDEDFMACIKMMVEHKESITAVDYMLATAIQYTSVEICRLLLENCSKVPDGRPLVDVGFPPRQGEADGEAPIFCALIQQSTDMVRLLLGKKAGLDVPWEANLNVKWLGMEPLPFAMSTNCIPEILELLGNQVDSETKKRLLKELAYFGEDDVAHAKRLKVSHWLQNETTKETEKARKQKMYKQISNTDIPPKGLSLRLKTDTVTRIVACANWCNTDAERPKIKSDMMALLNRISNRLANRAETRHFAFIPHFAGSSAEGTKTFNPDELDMVCVFKEDSDVLASGDTVVLLNEDSPWKAYSDDKKYILPRLAAEGFYKALGDAIKEEYIEEGSLGGIHLHPNTLDIRNKISLMQILYKSKNMEDLVVHVDVVPAFRLKNFQPYRPLLLDATCDEYHLIAKEGRHEYNPEKRPFRISYAGAEVSSIQALPNHVRNGYAVAKALRIGAVSNPPNLASLRLRQTVKADDYITSYMLKTCLLRIATEHDVTKGNAYTWTDRIYRRLQKEVNNRLLEAYFKKEDWILDCDEEHEPWFQHKCCKNREVILALCKSIRQWLMTNKEDLESITYGKHQVYCRDQTQCSKEDSYWVRQVRPQSRIFQICN